MCVMAATDVAASAVIGHRRRTATAATQIPIRTHRAGGSRSQAASVNNPPIAGVSTAPPPIVHVPAGSRTARPASWRPGLRRARHPAATWILIPGHTLGLGSRRPEPVRSQGSDHDRRQVRGHAGTVQPVPHGPTALAAPAAVLVPAARPGPHSSCTGDAHLGNTTEEYSPELTVEHRGYHNATTALGYLAGHYPDAKQVVVIGKTAGSVAAPLYGGLAADRLPDAKVTVFGAQFGAWPNNSPLRPVRLVTGRLILAPTHSVTSGHQRKLFCVKAGWA
jgi:hypothetical protein